MSKKTNMLQAALSQSGGKTQTRGIETAAGQTGEGKPASGVTGRAPSREGKVNVSGWLDPSYKRSLRMVQARTDKKIEPLLAEALNDLFAKYDVPQIREG